MGIDGVRGWRGKFYIDDDVNCSGITFQGVVGCVGLCRTLARTRRRSAKPRKQSCVYSRAEYYNFYDFRLHQSDFEKFTDSSPPIKHYPGSFANRISVKSGCPRKIYNLMYRSTDEIFERT